MAAITGGELWGGASELDEHDRVSMLWLRLTHRELTVIDFEYINAWRDAGISWAAIRYGIQKSLRNWKPKHEGDRVRSVAYCRDEVLAAAEREGRGIPPWNPEFE